MCMPQINLLFSDDFLFINPNYFQAPNKIVYEFPKHSIISSTQINKTYDVGQMKYVYVEAKDTQRKFIYDYIHKTLTTYETNYIVTTNVFVTDDMSYVCGNQQIHSTKSERHSHFRSGPLRYSFQEVILFGTGCSVGSYGHVLQDFFHPFLLLPEDVQRRAFVVGGYATIGKEIYTLLGYNPNNWVLLKPRTWAFCNIVHIFWPRPFTTCYCELAMKMKLFFFEKFNLYSIKPTRYCFSNRPENTKRHLKNFEEIFNATKKEFPQYKWEIVPDSNDLQTMAKAYASYKFLFMPTGSNLIKTYYMHNNTVIVSPTTPWYDYSVMTNSAATNVFMLHFPVKGMHHFNKNSRNIIAIPYALKQIRRGLKCLEEGKWEYVEIKDIPQENFTLLGYNR